MKKALFALLLLVGAAAMMANVAFAQVDGRDPVRLPTAPLYRASLASKAADLRTSATTATYDTIWFGHSYSNHFDAAKNGWNLWTGTSRPGQNLANNAQWDFEPSEGTAPPTDSLQGWWPIRRVYRATAGTLTDDAQRTWWAIDIGNNVNYVFPGSARKRGVVGVWHADKGNGEGSAVTWAPLDGSKSAWCGLREDGDNSEIDATTGIPYSGFAYEFNGEASNAAAAPTFRNLPGYVSQWDQILYRDITPSAGTPIAIDFLYRTRMDTRFDAGPTTRIGWFHGDPLTVGSPYDSGLPGNFISSNAAGTNSPVDSFTVYAGVPVNDNSCVYSDGVARKVYDPQRRWFDEVVQLFPHGSDPAPPLYWIFSTAGAVPADTAAATPEFNSGMATTLSAGQVDAIRTYVANPTGLVRLVFRVKTNRGFDDSDYKGGNGANGNNFTSFSRGAAIIDDVKINAGSGTVTIGSFEGAEGGAANDNGDASVNNSTSASALDNWKSTGKPPAVYMHPINVASVSGVWKDLCGPEDAPTRICDLDGVVVSSGNADDGDGLCDSRYLSMQEAIYGMFSPTIDLSATSNAMGIPADHVNPTDDYNLQYELYMGVFNVFATGGLWNYGAQWYPALQNNGAKVWSDIVRAPFSIYNPDPQCYPDIEGFKINSMVKTSNVPNVPDSMRVLVGILQECFAFGVSVGCNDRDGAYWDDISLGFTNKSGGGPLGTIGSDLWQFFQDAFPVNGLGVDNVPPGSAAFDTTTAYVKGTLNNAPGTNDLLRFDVLADSIVVAAPNGTGSSPNVRVDLVFRILPGPGNYQGAVNGSASAGFSFPPTSSMKLLKVPSSQSVLASSDPNCFWSQYIASPGQFSAGDHHGHTYWDYLTWNSARCDSAEINIFPVSGKAGNGLNLQGSVYMSTLHESDPKYSVLGITKNRCFLLDTALTAVESNITCDGVTTPAWLSTVPPSRTGWDGSLQTKEFTNIIPDGLLTPGSHVQYFWRKSFESDPTNGPLLDPDTTTIAPQPVEINFDGHRWQEFSVLPDRWKDHNYNVNSPGMACMLYVDNDDRRGNELVWVSVMDSVGGTAANKYGAHNGWHAPGGTNLDGPTNANLAAQAFVYGRNSQPGTTWDMYGVKGSESANSCGCRLGNRLANTASMGSLTNKQCAVGPKPDMLRQWYRAIALLTGDLNTSVLGPLVNISEDDISLIEDFLTTSTGSAQPRAFFGQGDGFVESEDAAGGTHTGLLNDYLMLSLRNASYSDLAGVLVGCADLIVFNNASTTNALYGIGNSCTGTTDVYAVNNGPYPEAVAAADYQNVGSVGPYVASVYKPAVVGRNWIALTDGWSINHTWNRYCQFSGGRLAYFTNMLNKVFGSMCGVFNPVILLDVPGANHGGLFVNFMKVGNSAMRTGNAIIHFGVANNDRVRIRLYDVTGRLVRTVADRSFSAGEYSLTWDGSDDSGNQVARGVYFARIEYATKGAPINGRVVVLR